MKVILGTKVIFGPRLYAQVQLGVGAKLVAYLHTVCNDRPALSPPGSSAASCHFL